VTFRWGVIGHGHISGTFREATATIDGAEIVAVAGRDLSRAQAYASEHGIDAAHDSIDTMLSAGGLDAVYVCTPHTAHAEAALACVEAGVPVLVEKPMTPTAATTRELVAATAAAGVFAMEAMWTRFLPTLEAVRSWIDEGRIGEVQLLTASFGFRAPAMSDHRLFSPELAGGGILDVGVYPLALAQWLYGSAPEAVRAVGSVGETGVDEHVAISARYPGGGLAQLGCAVRANLDHHAVIRGTDGHIEIPAFWSAQSATLFAEGVEESTETAHTANGFEYQIEEVMGCVAEGRTESPRMPHAASVELAELSDEIRDQIGVRYPFES
jgi:dihydrodiol dehydrogenase / D-xylose 1-dehydrogenase (NADP)